MTSRTASQSLTDATSALVAEHDTLDVLTRLVDDCARAVAADAVGLVVTTGSQDLELLAATSHRTAELEIFQVEQSDGPCIESIHSARVVTAVGSEDLRSRWPSVGGAIVRAGFVAAHAQPLLWRGEVLGGLNIFRSRATPLSGSEAEWAVAFADVAALALVQVPSVGLAEVYQRSADVLRERIVVEQAKGVLAYTEGIDLATAYRAIVDRSAAARVSMVSLAEQVIAQARGAGGPP